MQSQGVTLTQFGGILVDVAGSTLTNHPGVICKPAEVVEGEGRQELCINGTLVETATPLSYTLIDEDGKLNDPTVDVWPIRQSADREHPLVLCLQLKDEAGPRQFVLGLTPSAASQFQRDARRVLTMALSGSGLL